METFKKGDLVPTDWFEATPNCGGPFKVGTAVFGADVSVTLVDGERVVQPIGPFKYVLMFNHFQNVNIRFTPRTDIKTCTRFSDEVKPARPSRPAR